VTENGASEPSDPVGIDLAGRSAPPGAVEVDAPAEIAEREPAEAPANGPARGSSRPAWSSRSARAQGYRPGRTQAYQPERADPANPIVAVDAMGGDFAPKEIVAGAVAAHRQNEFKVVLVGRPGQVRPLLAKHGVLGEIRIVAAEDSVAMDEGALATWRRPRSSIAVACQLVHLSQASAVVSAGSTAAVVATARLRLRILPGVLRPAIAVALPTRPVPTVLIDAGAIADPKPEMLAQFAQLGTAYSEVAFGLADPTVGLLSIGAEPGKGNKLAKRAHELLSAEPQHGAMPIRFAGNVEGHDLLSGKVNVVVAEGFAGNVALKTLEGTARFTAAQFTAALGASGAARLGALLARKELRALRDRLDPETYGGAALLGLEGTVVIAHGSATERGVAAACALAASLARGRTTEKISERLGPHRQGHFLRRT
jgi:phosphate acyltransferase